MLLARLRAWSIMGESRDILVSWTSTIFQDNSEQSSFIWSLEWRLVHLYRGHLQSTITNCSLLYQMSYIALEVWEKMAMPVARVSVSTLIKNDSQLEHIHIFALLTVLFSLLGIPIVLAGITLTSTDRRNIRSINVLSCKTIPGDFRKPRVVLHIFGTSMKVAQSLCQIRCDELREQVDGVWVKIGRVLDTAAENVLVDLDGRATVPEGCEAAQHFEDKNSK